MVSSIKVAELCRHSKACILYKGDLLFVFTLLRSAHPSSTGSRRPTGQAAPAHTTERETEKKKKEKRKEPGHLLWRRSCAVFRASRGERAVGPETRGRAEPKAKPGEAAPLFNPRAFPDLGPKRLVCLRDGSVPAMLGAARVDPRLHAGSSAPTAGNFGSRLSGTGSLL